MGKLDAVGLGSDGVGEQIPVRLVEVFFLVTSSLFFLPRRLGR